MVRTMNPHRIGIGKYTPLSWTKNLTTRLLAIYVLNLFDVFVTAFWVELFGLGIEANPIARWMFATNCAYAFKVFGIGILLYFLNKYLPKYPKYIWTSWLLLGIYGSLMIYHIISIVRIIMIVA